MHVSQTKGRAYIHVTERKLSFSFFPYSPFPFTTSSLLLFLLFSLSYFDACFSFISVAKKSEAGALTGKEQTNGSGGNNGSDGWIWLLEKTQILGEGFSVSCRCSYCVEKTEVGGFSLQRAWKARATLKVRYKKEKGDRVHCCAMAVTRGPFANSLRHLAHTKVLHLLRLLNLRRIIFDFFLLSIFPPFSNRVFFSLFTTSILYMGNNAALLHRYLIQNNNRVRNVLS